MEIKGPRFYTVRCVCVCVCDMIDMYWLLFDKSDCLSYRRLNADLHWAARTAGTAVAAEDALEIAPHSYHLLHHHPSTSANSVKQLQWSLLQTRRSRISRNQVNGPNTKL